VKGIGPAGAVFLKPGSFFPHGLKGEYSRNIDLTNPKMT
jgi:hypothetical protein